MTSRSPIAAETKSLARLATLALASILLIACGGGGGSLTTPADASVVETDSGELSMQVAGERMTLDARSVSLKRLLDALAKHAQISVTGDLRGDQITLKFENLALEQAIAKILAGRSYLLEVAPDSDTPIALQVLPAGRLWQSDLELALSDPDVGTRLDALAQVNGNLTDADTQGLALALNDENLNVRVQAVEALETLDPGKARTMALLEMALVDASPDVRLAAVSLLPGIGGEAAVPALRTALNDPELTIRDEAVFALAEFRGAEATSALQTALNDPDEGVREIAAFLLSAPGREDSTE